ncbi:MAG: aminodeoxychorismate lyase [Gammaproteobacteria bacterium]|nr:aminodeoxychorismate lyase [Gammaproteobacteria bacterium]
MNLRFDAWLNGAPCREQLVTSRALNYGDGVFRTCLINAEQVVDADRHIDKLLSDARRLRLDPPAAATLVAEMSKLALGRARAVLKVLLCRQPGPRGYRPTTNDCDRLLILADAPSYPAQPARYGVRVFRSGVTLAEQPLLAGIKHLNRLEQVLAGADWPADMDEAILCDAQGRPVGGTRTNLFWAVDGCLQTPRLARCGVAGMMRDKVLDLATTLNLAPEETELPWSALEAADEVFLTNSLIGIWPVRELDGRLLPVPGALTRKLMDVLVHPELH